MENELRSSLSMYNPKNGEILKDKEHFYPPRIFDSRKRMFRKVMYDKQPALSDTDLGKWYRLIKYLEQHTNRLVKREKDKTTGWLQHRPLNKDDLKEILGISARSLHSFLKTCDDKGYIRYSKLGDIYLSPLYVMNGSWISVELFLIFRNVEEFNKSLSDKEKMVISIYLGIPYEEVK